MIQLFRHRQITGEHPKLMIALGFVLLFIFVLPGFMISQVPEVSATLAQNGQADISSLEHRNAVLRLEGEWEFYPNQLLTPADFAENLPAAQSVAFPHSWQDEPSQETLGVATYRLTGTRPAGMDSIGVYSRFQFGAYKIYVNGVEIVEIGRVSKNPADYIVSYRPAAGYISPAEGDAFEIILQIQCYDHVLSGFTGPVYIGDMAHIKFFTEFLILLNGIMIGFLLLLLCYFLVVYFQDRAKTLYLNFAIITLMSIYVTMATCNESIIYTVVPTITPHAIYKLEYITQIIAAFFSTQYLVKKYMRSQNYRYFTICLAFLITAALILFPSVEISKLRIPFQVVGVSFFFVPIFLTLRTFIRKHSMTAFWEFISLSLLISGIFLSKLGILLWNCVDLFPLMVTLYCFIQIVVLLYYYSGIEGDLKRLNQSLELRIEERTRELLASNAKAEAATAAKSDFLAQMSHEIRTPMNAIIGMSDLIETENLNETQRSYFRDIKEVSHSLLHIINDILDFSKIESGKFQIAPIHFNFVTMIDNICSLFYYSAKAKNLRFESHIDTTIPAVLYGDETRIRQSISNILSNAVKYTKKGTVRFSVERINDGKDLLFTVEDTGVGIRAEDQHRLFRLFEQINKNDSVQGTGLGLAICKQLTEMMGGSVTVKSEHGVGSVFAITLPLIEGDPALIETIEVRGRVYAHQAKVLVVDDNSINLTVAKGIFATHDIHADTADSGFEAVEMVSRKEYDLIFMDHMMPEMDGIETTAAIRALGGHNQKVPIIALTANAVTGAREFLIESGLTDFISKPIDRVALNTILAKWLPAGVSETRAPDEEKAEIFEPVGFDGVPGLNAAKGIAYVGGNEKAYRAVLKQFVYETPDYAAQLAPALDDLPRYCIIVHGIKGSLNSIGAEWLGEWAYNLEQSSKAGDREPCDAQTERFTGALLNFIDMLAPLLTDTEDANAKQPADAAALFETLEPLQMACILGDCTTVDELTASLKKYTFGDRYDPGVAELITFCENMAYDKAGEVIEQLRTLID